MSRGETEDAEVTAALSLEIRVSKCSRKEMSSSASKATELSAKRAASEIANSS